MTFEEDYVATSPARGEFRWALEYHYRKLYVGAKPGDLPRSLLTMTFPADFLKIQDISVYAARIHLVAGIWDFFGELFHGCTKLRYEPEMSCLLESLGATTRFWDKWSRLWMTGLSLDEAMGPLSANIADIRAGALANLAIHREMQWDHGRGQWGLNWLAVKGPELEEAKLDSLPEPLRSAVRDGNWMISHQDDEF